MDEELSSSAAFNSANFDTFNSNIQTCALKTTRNALSLPADVAFHRSMDPAFSKELDVLSSRVLSLTSKLLSLAASADATQSARGKGKGKLENQDDVVDNFHSLVVDSMDQLLERTVRTLELLYILKLNTKPGYMLGRVPWSEQTTCDCHQSNCTDGAKGLHR